MGDSEKALPLPDRRDSNDANGFRGLAKEVSIPRAEVEVEIHDQSCQPSTKSMGDNAEDTETGIDQFGSPCENVVSKNVVHFSYGDKENPVNWSNRKKYYVIVTGIVAVANSTLGSSLPGNAMPYISKEFHVTNDQQLVLPISLYLVGYVLGPLFFGPLSESYGRRPVMLWTFVIFTLFTMACALAPNWPALLVFRLVVGMAAASPISVLGGMFADVHSDPRKRGRAMAYFMVATTFGPIMGPVISGFVSVVSWRWTFWVELIIAGSTLPLVVFCPETYAPVLLQRRARRLRKEIGNNFLIAPKDLEKKGAKQMITVTLTRPIRMILFEAIVGFTCLYLSLAYAILYMFFEAYPIVFQGIYGMTIGVSGLAFLPLSVGSIIAFGIFMHYDNVLDKAKKRNAPWSQIEEYRRLPLACLGGPLYCIALFWLGWTAYSSVHWIVPMLSGISFGCGFLLIFLALLNYVTDAYETFAASAMGATSCCRSIFGAILPLGAKAMFTNLGVHWACTLLGFLSMGMCVIPFVFIKYGDRIRANSKFCQYLLELKRREAAAEERARRRAAGFSRIEDGQADFNEKGLAR